MPWMMEIPDTPCMLLESHLLIGREYPNRVTILFQRVFVENIGIHFLVPMFCPFITEMFYKKQRAYENLLLKPEGFSGSVTHPGFLFLDSGAPESTAIHVVPAHLDLPFEQICRSFTKALIFAPIRLVHYHPECFCAVAEGYGIVFHAGLEFQIMGEFLNHQIVLGIDMIFHNCIETPVDYIQYFRVIPVRKHLRCESDKYHPVPEVTCPSRCQLI